MAFGDIFSHTVFFAIFEWFGPVKKMISEHSVYVNRETENSDRATILCSILRG